MPKDEEYEARYTARIQEGQTTVHHIHDYGPVKESSQVKLTRNSKGYTWEISVTRSDLSSALQSAKLANENLLNSFAEEE